MTENNKLIAEFLGKEYKDNSIVIDYTQLSGVNPSGKVWQETKYHKDWNWLMEVVEKIRTIDQTAKGDFKTNLLHFQRNNKNIFDTSILEGKEYVYKLVLEFIKWYNEQKKV